jgi:carbon-monoxide dehydrogenase medium subunit
MTPAVYLRAESLLQASQWHAEYQDAKFLAGGHTLLPTMKQGLTRPSHLIDVSTIHGLNGVHHDAAARVLVIGAATRHAEVAAHPDVVRYLPALAGLAGSIGDRQVRNRGTIGGSLANNDPAADYPAGVLGLGGTIVTTQREISAEDFFVGLFETALLPGELIVQVRLPVPVAAGYAKFRSTASRYSLVGVFVVKTAESSGQGASAVRVAVTGAGSRGVFRATDIETALHRKFSVDALDGVQVDGGGLLADMNATSEYRGHLITVMARRAVASMGRVSVFM